MKAKDISRKNRLRKYNLFLEKLKPSANDKILDVGFANTEYSDVDNFLEKNYPYPSNITALGVEEYDLFKERYPAIEVIRYDGKTFPFEDKCFDIGWYNAVIEHVIENGGGDSQVRFLRELSRTCKKIYFTTPNRYFPVELHTRFLFIHWFPKPVFDKILSFTSKKWAAGNYMRLLSKKELKMLLKKANISNYHIYCNRFGGFTMDFSVVVSE